MALKPRHGGKGLARGLFLVLVYGGASTFLGLSVGFAALHALYPEVVGWRRPVTVAAMCVAALAVCWATMPANRPHVGALILRVAMIGSFFVGVFMAKGLMFGSGRARGREVLVLSIAAVVFAIGLGVARGTRWGRKWTR